MTNAMQYEVILVHCCLFIYVCATIFFCIKSIKGHRVHFQKLNPEGMKYLDAMQVSENIVLCAQMTVY